LMLIRGWMKLIQNRPSPLQISFGINAYDDCVADLDEQLGRLIDELDRRAIREKTWVIITSDHGESFGEKPGVFWHGTSLYDTQLHVPLLIIPPAGGPSPRVVADTVSLRDLPATIVDLVGSRIGGPFPGPSLVRFWSIDQGAPPTVIRSEPALAEVVPLGSFGPDPSLWSRQVRWPMAAVTDGDWTYIRREGEVREELFRVHEDSQEQSNLARDPALQPTLERMRATLDRLTNGPLTPKRFNP